MAINAAYHPAPFGLGYASLVASLAPVLWLRLRETSGTTAANSGSGGSGLDGTWTPGTGALGQTGQMGANEAYRYDALDSRISVPASTSINNLTNFTYAFLVNIATRGEGNAARFATDNGANRDLFIASDAPFRVNWQVFHTSDSAAVTTAAGAANGIAANTWTWVFATHDNTSPASCHIYFGRGGAVSEAAYSANTTSTNTLSNGSGVQNIGNRTASDRTLDGLLDEVMIFGSVLTTAQMLAITQASGFL